MKIAGNVHFSEIDSTNSWALRELERGVFAAPETLPFLVTADMQTAGRGQKTRTWHSPQGALLFTLIFDPALWKIPLRNTPLLGMASALAILDAASEFLPDTDAKQFRIHWPNDVFYGERKMSGILIEGHASGKMAAGIGVNFLNSFRTAPPELQERMFSFSDILPELKEKYTVSDFQRRLLTFLDARFQQLAESPEACVREADAACFQKGRSVTMQTPQGVLTGICEGLSADGALILNGKTFYTGMIHFE